jgi:hypothetical protein
VVLVPTPGQSEQVYLGERIKEKAIALVLVQERFSLSEAVRLAGDFFGFPESGHDRVLESILDSWLAEVAVGERITK